MAQRIDIASKLRSGGLWTRLSSHASGRRSGDQFNVYICDRFVIPTLTPRQQQDIGDGKLLLDQMTKYFIRRHLSYRFMAYPSGAEALAVERRLRAGQSPAGRPYLNPLWAPGWVATLWSRHRCTTIGKLRVGFLYLAPFGSCPRCKGTGHIKTRAAAPPGLSPCKGRGDIRRGRRRPVCPRCRGQRRIQRTGSRTVHRAARKIRHGRQAAARYQQEDSDGTP